MKILHFCYDHPDNPWLSGGGARRTWAVNTILAKSHDIDVICGAFPGALIQKIPFSVRFAGTAKGYKESRLQYILRSRQYDISGYDLIVEDFSVYAPVFPRLGGKPLVSIIHALYGFGALRYRGVWGFISLFGEKILLPGKKRVILVSDHLRPAVSKSAHIEVIGQGVNIPENLPEPGEEYVLFLGRLDIHVKGLDVLIKAWSIIPDTKRLMPLCIAGGGNQDVIRELIKKTGAEDVCLLGRLGHRESMEAINRAAFVCMPSRSEGFGLVAIESMALGKPVIASDIPSLKANVPHDVAGLFVPACDPAALAGAIVDLLTNLDLRSRLTEGAGKVGVVFTWERIAEEQERFYEAVLENDSAIKNEHNQG